MTGWALAGTAVVSLTLETGQRGFTDVAYVGVTLILTAVILARAGIVHDRLITELRAQAAIDPLTGLVTRLVLDDAIRSAVSSGAAHTGTTLILLDVDRFKNVNDLHGHPAGDDALSHIARILANLSRPQDVVARMGGDELAVLMPGCTYQAGVARAQQFVDAVRATALRLNDTTHVTLSISAGVAHAPGHASEVRDLYTTADKALYHAKQTGRGRVGLPALDTNTTR